jgi:hypothetical protein
MSWKTVILAGLLATGAGYAQDNDLVGKRVPGAAVSSENSKVAVLRAIASEIQAKDVEVVTDFIDKIYSLKDLYVQVLIKEQELRQSHVSDEAQKQLMQEYVRLLNDEKESAKKIIDVIVKDLQAHESRLLQVMAKVYRIGDYQMKTTIKNVQREVSKFVRGQLHFNSGDRMFYINCMRFLEQYFR